MKTIKRELCDDDVSVLDGEVFGVSTSTAHSSMEEALRRQEGIERPW